MVAFHFPPGRGSSGLLRTLNFSRDLPQYGWEPIVLTAHPRAYTYVDEKSVSQISSKVIVKRAFALDAARHLAVKGRYFDCMAIPDRWGSWLLGAVPSALRLIRKYKPRVLWSTYPIATAHVIGAILQRLTGIPWIADFRDPMVGYDPIKDEPWPQETRVRKNRMWVERLVMKYSTRAVFVTEGALQTYANRFPQVAQQHWALIPNGYDEESFAAAEKIPFERKIPKDHVMLLHSGGLYAGSGRDLSVLFSVLVTLRQNGTLRGTNLKIVLRGSYEEEDLQKMINRYGLEDVVFPEPPVSYLEALAEMLQADGLLLFQDAQSNTQIPAKVYEYLRAQRPIWALVDPAGDTAALLRKIGVGEICPCQDKNRIAVGLEKFLMQLHEVPARVALLSEVRTFSRQSRAHELAQVLNEVSFVE